MGMQLSLPLRLRTCPAVVGKTHRAGHATAPALPAAIPCDRDLMISWKLEAYHELAREMAALGHA